MSTTPTHSPDDPKMWRRLVARVHPDAGGDHELFIWTGAIRAIICDGQLQAGPRPRPADNLSRRREPSPDVTGRVPFDPFADFAVLTDRAAAMADAVAQPYCLLLQQLADFHAETDGTLYDQQRRGASWKQLAAIGHMVGMTKAERVQWYRVAESVPLSQRHAGHILSRLIARAA